MTVTHSGSETNPFSAHARESADNEAGPDDDTDGSWHDDEPEQGDWVEVSYGAQGSQLTSINFVEDEYDDGGQRGEPPGDEVHVAAAGLDALWYPLPTAAQVAEKRSLPSVRRSQARIMTSVRGLE